MQAQSSKQKEYPKDSQLFLIHLANGEFDNNKANNMETARFEVLSNHHTTYTGK